MKIHSCLLAASIVALSAYAAPEGYPKPVSALDLLPTALAAAGASPLPESTIDGMNLLPHLLDKAKETPHAVLYWRWQSAKAVHQGDWKWVVNNSHSPVELFNLADDPGEQTNLADREPERVKTLTALFDEWNAKNPPLNPGHHFKDGSEIGNDDNDDKTTNQQNQMNTMTPRDRVLRAFKRTPGLPDRVPVQFEFCAQLYGHFSEKLGIPMRYTKNIFEDVTYRISGNEIRTAMGCDVVVTGAAEHSGFAPTKFDDATWLNEYGMRMKQGSIYVEVTDAPLTGAMTTSDIAAYKWPDASAPGRYDDASDLVAKYHDEYVVIGDIEVTIFSLAQLLVGMEKLLMDMACEEEYVVPLFNACADFQTEIGLRLIEKGVDAIWFGDDFGGQEGLFISAPMFEEQLMPAYKRMIDRFKAAKPDIIPILHCDGAVSKLLPQIHGIGFEVFNPVQPGVPGHGPKEIKEGFGDLFAFWGAIDQQYLLPRGSDAELEADIKEKISILGHGGGYMISPAHIIQNDVSPERVETFIALCKKHGSYS